MAKHCVRFSNSGGKRHCASFSGGKRKRGGLSGLGRVRRRRGLRGLGGLSGDVAKCVKYAKTANGLWRCLMDARGPGGPQGRPASIKRSYRYSTSKARGRRLKTSKLVHHRGKRRGQARR